MVPQRAKSWQTGWYSDKTQVVDPSAGGCFDEKVYGVAGYGDPNSEFVLVKINNSTDIDYFVTFNWVSGINIGTNEAPNQVTVTSAGEEGVAYAPSSLLAKLGPASSSAFSIDGKNMVVNVGAINTSEGWAQVRISENGASCDAGCTSNAECDDGFACNGVELCDVGTSTCFTDPGSVCKFIYVYTCCKCSLSQIFPSSSNP